MAALPVPEMSLSIIYAPWGAYVLAVLSDRPRVNGPIVELSRRVYQYYDTSRALPKLPEEMGAFAPSTPLGEEAGVR